MAYITNFLQFIGLAFFLLAFTFPASAQDYKFTGTLKDKDQNPLGSATIFMKSVKDSTTINYTISDAKGEFDLEGKTRVDKVDFYISYTGFKTYEKRFSLKQESTHDLGEITLNQMDNTLGEVLIQGVAPPVRLKRDTLEFNASSFKTKENANMEDLLKKLPGVTVDNEGQIKVNGKDVSKIKVNGKDFFGDDPKIATKNLPKDILEKIQVVDTKTKSEEFTGKEGDSENKTINVTIKEDKNKGFFSRLTAGAGTDDRFSLNGIANYFNDDLRLSVLGSSNNINSIGFSFDEVYDALGRNAFSIVDRGRGGNLSFSGGGGGITKSQAGGLNFTNSWDETTDLSTNYFYNRASTETATKVQRENILPDRRYFNSSNSTSKRVNSNHRGSMEFEIEPDTLTRISFRPNVSTNEGYSRSNSKTESTEADGTPINDATTENRSNVSRVDFSNRIDATRKYGDQGGYFRLRFSNKNNAEKADRTNYTSRRIFDENGGLESTDVQDQQIEKDSREDEYAIDASARIPFSEKWKLDLGYDYTKTQNDNERLVYEKDENGEEYDVLNDDLSSDFKSESFQHRPNAGVVYRSKKLRAGLSGGLESTRLKNQEQFTETDFDNTYNNLYSRFYFRYRLSRTKSIYFSYRNSRDIPSVTQLQPVSNTTDPLNIITGNPNLKPTLNNRVYINYNNYDFKSHSGLYAYMGGRYYTDEVVSRTTTGEDLVRTTNYTNVDGTYRLFAGVSLNKTKKLEDGSSLKPKIGFRSNYSKDIGYSNDVKYNAKNFSINPRVSLEYDVSDVINVESSYTVGFNNTKYSLNSQRDQNYANHDVRLQVTSYWPKNFIFGNDITYSRIGNTAPGFESNYVLWNMSLGYKILGDDGIFKVKVFDVLDQNVSTRRDTGEDYIQNTQQLVLERYMMFSFTYKLSKFGGKKERKGGRYRH